MLRAKAEDTSYDWGVERPEEMNGPAILGFKRGLLSVLAIKGWDVRFHGNFWVVDMDDDKGAYLVSDLNRSMVHCCLGLREGVHAQVVREALCPTSVALKRVNMLPWYGRLVVAGFMLSPSSTETVADSALAESLRERVRLAKKQDLVISRLMQLEVPGGSMVGLKHRHYNQV